MTSNEAPVSPRLSSHEEAPDADANAQAKQTASVKKNYDILFLRLAIMFTLASLLAGSTALTFFLSSATWGNSLTQMVQSYQDDLIERSSDDIVHLFNSGLLCGRVLEGIVQRVYLAPLNDTTLKSRDSLITRAIFDTFTDCAQTSSLAFLKEDGTYTGISSSDNVTLGNSASIRLIMSFNNQSTPQGEVPPRYTAYLSEETGDPVTPPQVVSPIDPRLRDYYIQAKSSADGSAAQLLVGASGRPQFVLARRIALPKTGQFIGVVTVSFYLTTISRFMRDFDLKGGLMYVTNGSLLVADSVNDYPTNNDQPSPGIVPASQSSNPVVRESFSYLCRIGKVPGSDSSASREVHLGGDPYFLRYKDLLYRNITLRQVMVLPRQSILGSIDSGAKYTKAIVSGVAAAICGLGFLLIVLFTDPVSKEMRLKAQLIENLEAKRQAEAREEFKTNFFSRTSHDLRTPSAAMLGLLDVIIEAEHDPEQTERVQQVRECALNQLNLLNDLLDFSKIEAGKMKLESEPFDIGTMLESLTDILSVQCTAKGLEIGLDLSEAVPRMVRGDVTRCRQIFTNLLSNSIKFTKEGYVLLRCYGPPEPAPDVIELGPITPRVSEDQPPHPESNFIRLDFEIEDTGCGIPPEKRDLVFQDYCQADTSTTRNHGGTGLGLGIVQTLVRMMGGQIRIVEKTGPGTVFQFYLQFERDVTDSKESTQSRLRRSCPSFVLRREPAAAPRSFPTGFRVVLGSGRGLSRALAAAALRHLGGNVVECASWDKALEELRCLAAEVEDSVPEEALAQNGRTGSESPEWEGQPSNHKAPFRCALLALSLLPKGLSARDLEAAAGQVREALAVAGDERPVAVAWVVPSSTPAALRDALRRAGFPIIVNKPLYESKLHRLLVTLSRGQDGPIPLPESPVEATGHAPPESPRYSPRQRLEPSFRDWSGASDSAPGASLKKRIAPSDRVEILADEAIHVADFDSLSEVKAPAEIVGDQPLKGLVVLVAEDSPVLQLLAVKSVKKLGAEVVTANDGGEALAAFERRRDADGPQFDMVLIDCQMPVMSGLDVTRRIRAHEKGTAEHTPVVMLTATASAQDQHMSADAGVDLYLTKPINATTFVTKVVALLRKLDRV